MRYTERNESDGLGAVEPQIFKLETDRAKKEQNDREMLENKSKKLWIELEEASEPTGTPGGAVRWYETSLGTNFGTCGKKSSSFRGETTKSSGISKVRSPLRQKRKKSGKCVSCFAL